MVLLWLLKAVRAPSCVAAATLLPVLLELLMAVLLWLTGHSPCTCAESWLHACLLSALLDL